MPPYGLTEIRRAPAPTLAPLGLTATAGGAHEIDLACDACPLAQRYEFQRSANGVSGWSTIATVPAPSYANTGLIALTEYFYRVRGVNASGSGPWSSTASATTNTIHPLLDLVAGWALTAGPQQTMDSTGVVSGGRDFTAYGSPAYGANGVTLDGATQWLDTLLTLDNTKDLLLAYELTLASLPDPGVTPVDYGMADGSGGFFLASAVADGSSPGNIASSFGWVNDGPNYTGGMATASAAHGTHDICLGWFLHSTIRASAQVNDNTAQTAPQTIISPGFGDTLTLGTYAGGPPQLAGAIRRVRLWSGPNAATLAADATFRTWLAAGRSDAELAAYTP